MGVQKRFSNAASKKPNDYIPDEMKPDFLLLSSCDSKMKLRRNIKSDWQKLGENFTVSSA